MRKKLTAACMGIVAFAALVVAPAASASPILTSGAASVPVGTSITAKNTEELVFTGAFNFRCSTADLKGTILQNTGSLISWTVPVGGASISGTGTNGDCTSGLGSTRWTVESELCFTSILKTDQVSIDGCTNAAGETKEPISFLLDVTGTGPCTYMVNTWRGSYRTNTNATVGIEEQEIKLSSGGFFCPGSAKLDMDFDLYATGGTILTVS